MSIGVISLNRFYGIFTSDRFLQIFCPDFGFMETLSIQNSQFFPDDLFISHYLVGRQKGAVNALKPLILNAQELVKHIFYDFSA